MKKSLSKALIAASLICLFACNSQGTRERFVQTYAEVLVAREKYPDSTRFKAELNRIMERNDYSNEEFREDFRKYSANTDEMRAMLDSAQAKAQREINKAP